MAAHSTSPASPSSRLADTVPDPPAHQMTPEMGQIQELGADRSLSGTCTSPTSHRTCGRGGAGLWGCAFDPVFGATSSSYQREVCPPPPACREDAGFAFCLPQSCKHLCTGQDRAPSPPSAYIARPQAGFTQRPPAVFLQPQVLSALGPAVLDAHG